MKTLIFLIANCLLFGSEDLYFDETFHSKANLQDRTLYQKGEEDPIAFWEECAKEIRWFQPWDKGMEGNGPFAKWFLNGKLNVCYNCLDRNIEEGRGEKISLIALNERGEKRTLTYQDLYKEVNLLANILKSQGVGKGDRVAIYLPMNPEAIASMLACCRIGAVHTVIFGGIGSFAIRDRIQDAEAKVLITADGTTRAVKFLSYKSSVDEILPDCPSIEKVLLFNNCNQPIPLKKGRDLWVQDLKPQVDPYCPPEIMDSEDPLFILYTSGTTGKPKGIFHASGGYLVGVHNTFKWVFDLKPEDIYWCSADVGWITGHSFVVYGPLSCGVKQVIYDGAFHYPDKKQFGKIIEENKVSIFYTAPTFLRMLIQWGDECTKGIDFSSLRLLGSIGEPLNPEVWHWYHQLGGKRCPIVDTWFQTETGAFVISPLPGITPLKPGSVTQALPGYDIAVLDDQGNEAQTGFLAIRKPFPSMMRGIYKDQARYIATYWAKWNEKYYYAGDSAYWDSEGYLWIAGRADEVIKVSGHRIGTAEIENVLLEHPAVAEASAIGIQDELKGQKILAFVILKDGVEKGIEEDLRQTVARYLGAYARPEQVVVVGKLPKTRSGKILRRVLKNMVEGAPIGDTSSLADPTSIEELFPVCRQLYYKFYSKIDLSRISEPVQTRETTPLSPLPAEEILSIVAPLLAEHLQGANYDRLHLLGQYLDFYDQAKMSPLEALQAFEPDPSISPYHGSSCYGLTLDLLGKIPPEVHAFCVPATLPLKVQQKFWPKTCHAAIAIKIKDGYILMDPNFDMGVPVFVPLDGSTREIERKAGGIWAFHYESGQIICQGQKNQEKQEHLRITYEMREFLNPTEVGLKSMMATDRKIALVSRDAEGNREGHINLLLDRKEISWSIHEKKQPPISFEDFLQGRNRLSNSFSKLLHLEADQLNDLILKVIQHQEKLDLLYQEYTDFLKNHPRAYEFSS